VFDSQGKRKYLNASERQAFLRVVMLERDYKRRAFSLTLFYGGCRISEALNLTVERLDLANKNAVFETLKQRRRGVFRSVPLPDALIVLYGRIANGLAPSARVWTFSRATAYRLIIGYMVKAKIEGAMACPKGLRHGFAVACLAKKIPLTTLRKWMGHARLETTAIYLDVSGKEERQLAERLWRE
jgi:integrase